MRKLPIDQYGHTLTMQELHDPTFRQQVQAQLRAYNHVASTVRGPEARSLLIKLHNAQGQQVGGLVAATYWDWLVIDLVVIDVQLRRRGFGRHMMLMAENEARQRECRKAHTSTYAFQALAFYQHLQYQVVGQLADYPIGYTLYWLRKDL